MSDIQKRILCCLTALIILFAGLPLEMEQMDPFAFCTQNSSSSYVEPVSYIANDQPLVTLSMLKQPLLTARVVESHFGTRLVTRLILQAVSVDTLRHILSFYQYEETKEDGQLFLCRCVAIDFIHLMDGEK